MTAANPRAATGARASNPLPGGPLPGEPGTHLPPAAATALGALRIATGFVFLWAFLDKAFGLGYATSSDSAWVNGGSPAAGYLGHISVGPLESTYQSWSGEVWADWLYMTGMLGVGVALIAGVGLRIAAVSGSLMMLMLWVSAWPPAQHLSDGSPSGSNNPLVDNHVVYAGVMIVMALLSAGRFWGLGGVWERTPLVARNPWLK